MKKIKMLTALFVLSTILIWAQVSESERRAKFQIGMYGLQPSPGTKGHQNGSVAEMKDELSLAQRPSSENNIGVNAAIAYRHWDRVDHPNWSLTNYVTNYLEEMYFATINEDKSAGIQVLTPPLYSSFLQTPLKTAPEDDKGNDRVLDVDLFKTFVESVLQKELEIVLKATEGNIELVKEIMSAPHKRPLGGWYLDDEPLVRNHDIEVLNTMSSLLKIIEENFYAKNSSLYLNNRGREAYSHPTHVAFDADDLHRHPNSGRPNDGTFYNLNGKNISIDKGKIYTIFNPGTVDVIMPDYYGEDDNFWNVILNDIDEEFANYKAEKPKVMPVVKSFIKKRNALPTSEEYEQLIQSLLEFNIAGVWFYSWRDSFGDRISASELWKKEKADLGRALKVIE